MVHLLMIKFLVIVGATLVMPLIIVSTASFGSLPPLLSHRREMIQFASNSIRYALKIFSIGLEPPGPQEALCICPSLSMELILLHMYLSKCDRTAKEL